MTQLAFLFGTETSSSTRYRVLGRAHHGHLELVSMSYALYITPYEDISKLFSNPLKDLTIFVFDSVMTAS